MQATATSKSNNKNNPSIKPIKLKYPKVGPCDPNRVNSKCPATILAANRIDKVKGRIIFETVSITTITGIKNLGVPTGTKWASKLLYW